MRQLIAFAAFAFLMFIANPVQARVVGFEVISRSNVAYGYERIIGRLHLAERPDSPANRRIVDIGLAPVDTAGDVEATADVEIVHPKNTSASNGAAIVEVPNRGAKAIIFHINESPKFGGDPANPAYWVTAFSSATVSRSCGSVGSGTFQRNPV